MRILIYVIVILLFNCCSQPQEENRQQNPQEQTYQKMMGIEPLDPFGLFTLADAERILGTDAHLSSSETKNTSKGNNYSMSYTINTDRSKSENTTSVYAMFEQCHDLDSAKAVYTSIKSANKNHKGFKTLEGIGDEAYFHSDDKNFYFIMVRKGNNLFRMKVSRITDKTSLNDFNRVAARIAKDI